MNAKRKRMDGPPAGRSLQEWRDDLALKIAWFIGDSERLLTEVPGLLLVRRTAPTAPCTGTYTPSIIVVAQGSKRVDLGKTTFTYGPSRFLLTSIDLPIVSQLVDASAAKPLLALALQLEMPVVRELLNVTKCMCGTGRPTHRRCWPVR